MLRSGFLAHGGSADDVLAVDLSSARVRRALDCIDGVRHGEQLAAVLGYRIDAGCVSVSSAGSSSDCAPRHR